MHILHNGLFTFPEVLTRRICLTIERFLSWWSFPLFSWPLCLIQGWYCKEKLDASHSQGSKGYADVTRFRANAGQLCVSSTVLCSVANWRREQLEHERNVGENSPHVPAPSPRQGEAKMRIPRFRFTLGGGREGGYGST